MIQKAHPLILLWVHVVANVLKDLVQHLPTLAEHPIERNRVLCSQGLNLSDLAMMQSLSQQRKLEW